MFFLALRQLLTRRRQTILTLMGIVLGTAAYVAISGMMLGFQLYIVDQLVNNDSHIRVSAREEALKPAEIRDALFDPKFVINWLVPPSGRRESTHIQHAQGWFARLDGDPRVASWSEQLVVQGLVSRGAISQTARIVGTRPERQEKVTTIEKYMTSGHFRDIATGNRIVLGEGLLAKLGARVKETISISSGAGPAQQFKIVGSFRLGISTIDDGTIFGSLADVQKLNRTPSQISDIAVRLFNVELASTVSTAWADTSPDKVQSWDQANTGILSVFTTQDIVRNFMTISILIVAGFGIYNILNMVVTQKRKEIGILRSMGYERRDILTLFLVQGLILGFLGGVIGIGLGFIACTGIGMIKVDATRLGNGTMMMSYVPSIYVKGFALAFGSSLVASILPALHAGRLSPIDIIRSENS